MNTLQGSGNYKVKETGETVAYDFAYHVFDSVADAVEVLGEGKALATIQRMVKVDSNNTAREKAKTANGHSTRAVLSEEDKADRKASRQADKGLLAILKAKGLTLEDLENL